MEPTVKQIEERKAWRELGLTDYEYELIKERLGRAPNWTELGMFSGLWSEHCSYKHSRSLFHLFRLPARRSWKVQARTQESSTSEAA